MQRIISRANGTDRVRITATQLAREATGTPPNRRPQQADITAAIHRLRGMLCAPPPDGWASVEESWDSGFAVVLRRG